jgi:hypothetical protein
MVFNQSGRVTVSSLSARPSAGRFNSAIVAGTNMLIGALLKVTWKPADKNLRASKNLLYSGSAK